MCQDDEDKEVSLQEFDVVRSKLFNIHSMRLVITKLKTKSSQKVDKCGYKIYTGSDGSLMPISMYKRLFLHANINELNLYFYKINSFACL